MFNKICVSWLGDVYAVYAKSVKKHEKIVLWIQDWEEL